MVSSLVSTFWLSILPNTASMKNIKEHRPMWVGKKTSATPGRCVTWPQFPTTESHFPPWQRCTPWTCSCTPVEVLPISQGVWRWHWFNWCYYWFVRGRNASSTYLSKNFALLSFDLPFCAITLIPKKQHCHVFCSPLLQNTDGLFIFMLHTPIWLLVTVEVFKSKLIPSSKGKNTYSAEMF